MVIIDLHTKTQKEADKMGEKHHKPQIIHTLTATAEAGCSQALHTGRKGTVWQGRVHFKMPWF